MILVSVIIPAYNASDTIEAVIDSVINQTFDAWELIVVNDGSEDDTEEKILRKIIEFPNKRLRYYRHNNQGVSFTRNFAADVSKGTYLAFLDSDDCWLPNKLERQMKYLLEVPNIKLLGCGRNGKIFRRFLHLRFDTLTRITTVDLLWSMFFITSTVVVRKEVFYACGKFPEHMSYCEDARLFQIVSLTNECYYLNESLVNWGSGKFYFGDKGLSSKLIKMQHGEISNITHLYNLGVINFLQLLFFTSFSYLKFARRIIVSKFI